MSPDYVYAKAPEWEIRTTPDRIEQFALPQGLCVELKWLDGDEFAHWTNPEAFATSIRNRRKRREWLVWNALHAGEVPEGVVEIVAPEGVHVVDHVTHTWLPRAPRPSWSTTPTTPSCTCAPELAVVALGVGPARPARAPAVTPEWGVPPGLPGVRPGAPRRYDGYPEWRASPLRAVPPRNPQA